MIPTFLEMSKHKSKPRHIYFHFVHYLQAYKRQAEGDLAALQSSVDSMASFEEMIETLAGKLCFFSLYSRSSYLLFLWVVYKLLLLLFLMFLSSLNNCFAQAKIWIYRSN